MVYVHGRTGGMLFDAGSGIHHRLPDHGSGCERREGERELMGGLLFGILMVCLVFGIPIAVALLTAVFQCVLAGGNFAYFQMIVQRMFIAMDSVSNAAVPFFILAGNLMEYGGISKRLIGFVRILMKKIPASLSCITVGGSGIFRGYFRFQCGYRIGNRRNYGSTDAGGGISFR